MDGIEKRLEYLENRVSRLAGLITDPDEPAATTFRGDNWKPTDREIMALQLSDSYSRGYSAGYETAMRVIETLIKEQK